jgi:hypothetical protein
MRRRERTRRVLEYRRELLATARATSCSPGRERRSLGEGFTILPVLSDADITYIRRNFVALSELCELRGFAVGDVQKLIEQRYLPRPSYSLDDGTEMVPPDYFALYDDADAGVGMLFRWRFAQRAQELGVSTDDAELDKEWEGYLSGDYGVCLREVTPLATAPPASA